MILLLIKFVLEVGLLGAAVVGIILKTVGSGRVTKISEVVALRRVIEDANKTVALDNPSKHLLRTMGAKLVNYGLNLPVVLFSSDELAVLAPFIEIRLRDGAIQKPKSAHDAQAALAEFKARMVNQDIWPHPASSQTATITEAARDALAKRAG